MPPQALEAQNSSAVLDVTTDALRCVQFAGAAYGVINSNIVGSRSGPGQEDCLKLWIWKPVNISAGAKLPVMLYIHVSDPLFGTTFFLHEHCLTFVLLRLTGWRFAIQCTSQQ